MQYKLNSKDKNLLYFAIDNVRKLRWPGRRIGMVWCLAIILIQQARSVCITQSFFLREVASKWCHGSQKLVLSIIRQTAVTVV